ncbi:MAG: glycosyltransferase family 4 protein [Gemmatimonadaceae bacterium]|nr:glycosyltransferase family 4 protein [Gemmatimonadaceae bacterium]
MDAAAGSPAAPRREEGRKPSLLFVNQHYWPDVASTGQHLTDLAEHLAAEGYQVSILASRGKYVKGKVPAPLHEVRNGVTITRVRTTGFGRGRHLGRLVDYATFYLQALGALLAGTSRHDGVVVLTTPPLLSFLGAIAKKLRGQRYGIWSMDLHPDAEIATGMLKPTSLAARALEWMNGVGYREADFVVDLGAHMKARIVAKGVRPERTHTVHVWNRKEEVEPTPRDANPLIDELRLREKFVVMYSGNAGLVHEFGPILEAMRRTKDDPKLFWLFVGDGPRRREIEAYVAEHGIANTAYRDYFPREQLKYSLSVADAHLISLRAPFVGISVPGKLYGIMASGRPAIFVGPERSESGETVLEAGCGLVVDPASGVDAAAARIVEAVREWASRPEEARAIGARGRAAFLAGYEKERCCAEFGDVIAARWVEGRAAGPRFTKGSSGAS